MAKATKSDLEKRLAELDQKLAQITSAVETQRAQTQASQQAPQQQAEPQQAPQQETAPQSTYATVQKSRQEQLADYEAEYLARLENERRENEELMRAAAELRAQRQGQDQPSTKSKGTLPKGF